MVRRGTQNFGAICFQKAYTRRDVQYRHTYESGLYDRVLVDAPCSSERHVMHSGEEMLMWNPKRTRTMAARQVSRVLFCTSLLVV